MSSSTEALQARESSSLSRQPAIGRKSTGGANKVNDCGNKTKEACDSSVTAELQCRRCINSLKMTNRFTTLRQQQIESHKQERERLEVELEKMKVRLSAAKNEISRARAGQNDAKKEAARLEGKLTYEKDNYDEILARRLREAEDEQRREWDLEYERKQRSGSCFGFFASTRVDKALDRALVVAAMLLAVVYAIELSQDLSKSK